MTSGSSGAFAMDDVVEFDWDERRIGNRQVVSLKARLRLQGGALMDSITVDISETGVGFFAPRMLAPDQECKLFVDLSACGTEMELKLVGKICYCREQSVGKFRVGMRFVGLESDAAEMLAAMLR
ncbi:MAG: PilZ domain-containing protein [Steroidobacteraceae bacterium]